jgi:hypothetical protein
VKKQLVQEGIAPGPCQKSQGFILVPSLYWKSEPIFGFVEGAQLKRTAE